MLKSMCQMGTKEEDPQKSFLRLSMDDFPLSPLYASLIIFETLSIF